MCSRRWRCCSVGARVDLHAELEIALLAGCAGLQVATLLGAYPHVLTGTTVERRSSPPLEATPRLFVQLVGGGVLTGTLIGPTKGLIAALSVQLIAIVLVVSICVLTFRSWRHKLRIAVIFAVAHPKGRPEFST